MKINKIKGFVLNKCGSVWGCVYVPLIFPTFLLLSFCHLYKKDVILCCHDFATILLCVCEIATIFLFFFPIHSKLKTNLACKCLCAGTCVSLSVVVIENLIGNLYFEIFIEYGAKKHEWDLVSASNLLWLKDR